MSDLYVVSVDTRGKSSSDISGYEEHLSSEKFFTNNIVGHADAICFKSIVAELCGLDMKVYFHKSALVANKGISGPELNRAATLLTLDPKTGFSRYHVRGIAYVVLSDGLAPLSFRQVWGIQELANYAKDTYKINPENLGAGRRNLLRLCKDYRKKEWGPLSIYEYRSNLSDTVTPPTVIKLRSKAGESDRQQLHHRHVDAAYSHHRAHDPPPRSPRIKS
eukprot:CAMPEP_0119545814 /NCGR_PEP_ID=MMETSP1352-20130426/459_1 /TAXON_ID=265584 /ORGANISM="Stauroneis constricta, Strain CCMP1120" /LENGTH=219 /DNA_ID=CAMNT_0007590417 /DNA_START=49 /DNA_END=708 /DNA_ORIENTATION=-